jgi:hypothetical protein
MPVDWPGHVQHRRAAASQHNTKRDNDGQSASGMTARLRSARIHGTAAQSKRSAGCTYISPRGTRRPLHPGSFDPFQITNLRSDPYLNFLSSLGSSNGSKASLRTCRTCRLKGCPASATPRQSHTYILHTYMYMHHLITPHRRLRLQHGRICTSKEPSILSSSIRSSLPPVPHPMSLVQLHTSSASSSDFLPSRATSPSLRHVSDDHAQHNANHSSTMRR